MSRLPRTVRDLANLLGVLPEEVRLPCRFCRRLLDEQCLLDFDHKYFQLIWKPEEGVFGCCRFCSRFLANAEHAEYCRMELPGCDMLQLVRVPLNSILIRCRGCFKILSFLEKICMIRRGIFFCHVRGWWRGLCRYCSPP